LGLETLKVTYLVWRVSEPSPSKVDLWYLEFIGFEWWISKLCLVGYLIIGVRNFKSNLTWMWSEWALLIKVRSSIFGIYSFFYIYTTISGAYYIRVTNRAQDYFCQHPNINLVSSYHSIICYQICLNWHNLANYINVKKPTIIGKQWL
jgi:hypothetical protein